MRSSEPNIQHQARCRQGRGVGADHPAVCVEGDRVHSAKDACPVSWASMSDARLAP